MYSDGIISKVTINLYFIDRLILLISGKVTINIHVKTENIIGKTETSSSVEVGDIFKSKSGLKVGCDI